MLDLRKLKKGYKRFYKKFFVKEQHLFYDLKTTQNPKTLVISCCDSRVDPAIVMNTDPGEIFVVRNIANLVPQYCPDNENHGTSAAIEFAVKYLKVNNIIIMGHSNCGGICKLLTTDEKDIDKTDFLDRWIFIAKKAKEITPSHLPLDKQRYICEKASIKISLENLLTFPFVKEAVDSGQLNLYGWYFKVNTGSLYTLNPKTELFEKVNV